MSNKKTYRKYAATTIAAAAAVASVAPVATAADTSGGFSDVNENHDHYEAITALTASGLLKGYEDGTFKPSNDFKRVGVAKMLVRALDLDIPENADEILGDYVDVSKEAQEDRDAIAAVTAAGIFKGNANNEFNPWKAITREQFATVIVRAFNLEQFDTGEKVDINLKGVDASHASNVQILANLGITQGTALENFGPNLPIKRGQLASQVQRAYDAISPVVTELAVESVSAINATTLEVKGAGLQNLTTDNISVKDNTVASIKVSTDGKTATVTLSNALLLDTAYTVEVEQEDETKSFEVSYSLVIQSAVLENVTLDDDTIGQRVPLKVNGQNADYDTLAVGGYTIEFVAVDSDGIDATATLFKDVVGSVAVSPVVEDNVALDDYTVEVSIIKDGTVVVSDTAVVKVRNLELTTSNIEKINFTNSGDAVIQNSTTLVTGETLTLDDMDLINNGVKTNVGYSASDMLVTSSNPAVLSVDGDDITANTPGTAVLTFSYGDFEKKVNYTVTNTARKLTKVTTSPTSTTIIIGQNVDVKITAVDQYGDTLDETITVEAPANGIVTVPASVDTDDGQGRQDVTVTQNGTTFGSGVVLLKDSTGKTIGSFGVKTTAIDNVHTKKFEVVKYPRDVEYSDDFSLDMAGDDKVQVAYNQYTSENVANGVFDLNGGSYTVTYNGNVIDLAAVETSGKPSSWTGTTGQVNKAAIATENLAFQAVGVGSSDVVVYDDQGRKVHQFRITVTNTDFAIKNVTFKPQTKIDYAGKVFTVNDFITLVRSDNDDIVKGIALNKATDNVIRVAQTAGAEALVGDLYIDANGNGSQDAGEKILGSLEISVVSGGSGTGDFAAAGDFDLFTGDMNLASTATGDKGTLVFKVYNTDTTPKIIASTSVSVDVK